MSRSELLRRAAGEIGPDAAASDAGLRRRGIALEAGRARFAALGRALARGETVRFPGFGTFVAKGRPARTGRNPRTGAAIAAPASRSVSFRPGKALKDAVNGARHA